MDLAEAEASDKAEVGDLASGVSLHPGPMWGEVGAGDHGAVTS